MEDIPSLVSITFILTTFLTIGFLFHAIKQKVLETTPAKIVVSATAFWIFFTTILSLGGFYQITSGTPQRFIYAPIPALLFIIFLFIFYRESFISQLPLKILTLLQIVRVPVEIVLYLLYQNEAIPQIMTFKGRNFDILAGISAPIICLLAFRKNGVNKKLLIIWNVICLILVTNIVITAVLSLPTDFQLFGINQPNRAILFFPYILLPSIVVPIVYFAHFTSLWQLFNKKPNR